jgi:hypothetical protein
MIKLPYDELPQGIHEVVTRGSWLIQWVIAYNIFVAGESLEGNLGIINKGILEAMFVPV